MEDKFKVLDDVRIKNNTGIELPLPPGTQCSVTAIAGSTIEVKYEYGNEEEYHEIDERYLSEVKAPEKILSQEALSNRLEYVKTEMNITTESNDMDYLREESAVRAIDNVFQQNPAAAFSANEEDLFGLIVDEFVEVSKKESEEKGNKTFNEKYCRLFLAEEASSVISQAMAYKKNHFELEDIISSVSDNVSRAIALLEKDNRLNIAIKNSEDGKEYKIEIIFDNFDGYEQSKVPAMEEAMANKKLGALSEKTLKEFAVVPDETHGLKYVRWGSLADLEKLYVLNELKPGFNESRGTSYPDRDMAVRIKTLEGFEDEQTFRKYSAVQDFNKALKRAGNPPKTNKLANSVIDLYKAPPKQKGKTPKK